MDRNFSTTTKKQWFLVSLFISFIIGVHSKFYYESIAYNVTNLVSLVETVHNTIYNPLTTLVLKNVDDQLNSLVIKSLQDAIGGLQISQNLTSKLTILIFNQMIDIYQTNSKQFWDPDNYFILYFPNYFKVYSKVFDYLKYSFNLNKVMIAFSLHDYVYIFDPLRQTTEALLFSDLNKSRLFATRLPVLQGRTLFAVFAGWRIMNNNDMDILLMKAISDKFKMRLEIMNTTDGRKYGMIAPNGTFLGTYKDLIEGRVNLTANSHFIVSHKVDSRYFDCSRITRTSKVCFGVKKSRAIPPFIATMRSLNFFLFFAVIFSYGAAGIALRYLRKISSLYRNEKLGEVNSILTMFGLCLGIPVTFQPRMAYERFIFSSVVLVSFIVVNLVQTTFTTILTTPSTTYEIPKTKEAINSLKFPVWTSSFDLIQTFKRLGYTGVQFHLRTRYEQKIDFWPPHEIGILEKVQSSMDVNKLEYKPPINFQLTNVCERSNSEALMFPRGSPFLRHIDEIISHLEAGGLLAKWCKEFYENEFWIIKSHKVHVDTKPIGLNDIEIPLLFTAVNLTVAFIAFLLELLTHRIQERKKTRRLFIDAAI